MSNRRGKAVKNQSQDSEADGNYSAELVFLWLRCTTANTVASVISRMSSMRLRLERSDWIE